MTEDERLEELILVDNLTPGKVRDRAIKEGYPDRGLAFYRRRVREERASLRELMALAAGDLDDMPGFR